MCVCVCVCVCVVNHQYASLYLSSHPFHLSSHSISLPHPLLPLPPLPSPTTDLTFGAKTTWPKSLRPSSSSLRIRSAIVPQASEQASKEKKQRERKKVGLATVLCVMCHAPLNSGLLPFVVLCRRHVLVMHVFASLWLAQSTSHTPLKPQTYRRFHHTPPPERNAWGTTFALAVM